MKTDRLVLLGLYQNLAVVMSTCWVMLKMYQNSHFTYRDYPVLIHTTLRESASHHQPSISYYWYEIFQELHVWSEEGAKARAAGKQGSGSKAGGAGHSSRARLDREHQANEADMHQVSFCKSIHPSFAFKRLLPHSSCTTGRRESVTQQEYTAPRKWVVPTTIGQVRGPSPASPPFISLSTAKTYFSRCFLCIATVIVHFTISLPIPTISPAHHASNSPTDD